MPRVLFILVWLDRRQIFKTPAALADAHRRSAHRRRSVRARQLKGLTARVGVVVPAEEDVVRGEGQSQTDRLVV